MMVIMVDGRLDMGWSKKDLEVKSWSFRTASFVSDYAIFYIFNAPFFMFYFTRRSVIVNEQQIMSFLQFNKSIQ